MDDSAGIRQYADDEIRMRFRPLEVTPDERAYRVGGADRRRRGDPPQRGRGNAA
jgi:hypothetical protein